MAGEYCRRQRAGNWPRRGKWSPERLPDWYLKLICGLASDLTAWRKEIEHDPGQRLDPRHDPQRRERRHMEERAIASR